MGDCQSHVIDLHAAIETHLGIMRLRYRPAALQHGKSTPVHLFTRVVETVVGCGLLVATGLVPRVASHLSVMDNLVIHVIMLDGGRAMIMTTRSVHDHDLKARWYPATQLEARWYPATQLEARRYPGTRSDFTVVYFTLSWQG